jgi:hypothetical protein
MNASSLIKLEQVFNYFDNLLAITFDSHLNVAKKERGAATGGGTVGVNK